MKALSVSRFVMARRTLFVAAILATAVPVETSIAARSERAPIVLDHVANTSELLDLEPRVDLVRRDGADRAGDGGSMVYRRTSARCRLNRGTGDGGAEIAAKTGGCWLAQFPAGGRDVRVWGAKADGSTDTTRALQAAVASFEGASGAVVLPAGRFLVDGTLFIEHGSVTIRGAGKNVTILMATSAAADVIAIGGEAFDITIADMTIRGTAPKPSAGCALALSNGVGDISLQNLRIGEVYRGFCMTNPPVRGVSSLLDIDFENMVDDTLRVDGASQIFLSGVTSWQSKANPVCLHIVSASGFYFQNVTCGGSVFGLLVKPPAGKAAFDGFITNFEADNSQEGGAGLSFDSSLGGKIYDIRASNIRAGFGRGVGFEFSGGETRNINIVNFTTNRNTREGILIMDLRDSSLAEGQVLGNSSIEGGHAGVSIVGGTRFTLRDLRVTRAYGGAADSNQTFGIAISEAFVGSAQIIGGDVSGNTAGGLLVQSRSHGLVIKDVAGYNPIGARTRTLGRSPWTYTAGSSPETEILSGGSCSRIDVDGMSMPITAGPPISLPLAPGQSMSGICTVNPNLVSLVQ